MVPAGKCGGEHENGRFRCMEVGNKGVDNLEFETWIDENVVFAFGLAGFGPEFERAGDGGANSDNTMAGFFGFLDGFDGFCRNMEPFGVHMVFLDIVGADRQEGA